MSLPWPTLRILIPGGAGFLGRHVAALLGERGSSRLCIPRRASYDLTLPAHAALLLREAFAPHPPDLILNCAGAVGGLGAHKSIPATFAHDNTAIVLNLAEAIRLAGLAARTTLLHIGSMTSYPETAPVPFREESLWQGYPEPGTAPYAIAKLAALPLLQAYHAQYGLKSAYIIPTNLFGPGDNFNPKNSHAAAAIIRRCIEAADQNLPEITNWGTGNPSRQFLYIQDAARGLVAAAEWAAEHAPGTAPSLPSPVLTGGGGRGSRPGEPRPEGGVPASEPALPIPINLGTGAETTIRQFTESAARAAGYTGRITWDPTKPDGIARRSLSPDRAAALLNWRAEVPLDEGIRRTVEWYRSHR
jgi:GDP-L-fucose synthase